MQKKFIVTSDEAIATKLIADGFKVASQINGKYTFINQAPKSFSFDELDKLKVLYTNIMDL